MRKILLLSLALMTAMPASGMAQGRRSKVYSPCLMTNNSITYHVKCVVKPIGDSIFIGAYNTMNTTKINPHFSLKFHRSLTTATVSGYCIYPSGVPFTISITRSSNIPRIEVKSSQQGIVEVSIINLKYY